VSDILVRIMAPRLHDLLGQPVIVENVVGAGDMIGASRAARATPDAAGGIPRYGITRRGGNNDRLSTLWREVISLAGVARSFSSGGG
jgi:hypothetical protein